MKAKALIEIKFNALTEDEGLRRIFDMLDRENWIQAPHRIGSDRSERDGEVTE